jgi:hypothetical protein
LGSNRVDRAQGGKSFYTGPSSYLLLSKYNDYLGIGGGREMNKIAIIDPNVSRADPIQPSVTIMTEVETLLEPTQFPGAPEGATNEWCLNNGVVDVKTHSVFAHGEDGYLYRWDLATGLSSQNIRLNAPLPETYTWTVVGRDGTVYAINSARLYAIGK